MYSFRIYDYDSIKFNILKIFNNHLRKFSKNKFKFIENIIKISNIVENLIRRYVESRV